ncbi:MAG: PIN domain-containing protein [Gemmatimonadaceae bacterium]
MKVTLDASVWLATLTDSEPHHAQSQAAVRRILEVDARLYQPEIFAIEVAAAVARRSGNRARALQAARLALAIPGATFDGGGPEATVAAVQAASTCALRAGDAHYVATAQRHDAVLISLDAELCERGGRLVTAMTPATFLASLGA